MEFNLAGLFESVAARVPERLAIAWGETRTTFAELEERTNRLANSLLDLGVEAGDHIGILTYSRPEYLETMIAAYKIRAVPINVNYRYVAKELAYLFDNADLKVLVHEACFGPVVAAVRDQVPTLRWTVVVEDGSDGPISAEAEYEKLIGSGSPKGDFGPRSGDDHYIAYTGGTTGLPKGVVWRQEDIYFATMTNGPDITKPEDVAEAAVAPIPPRLKALAEEGISVPDIFVSYALGPLMHVAGHWSAWGVLLSGGTAVLHPDRQLDARRVLEVIEQERVTMLTVVGDSMGRPLADLLEAEPGRYDTSSILMLGSGGSILSGDVKDRLFASMPNAMILTEAIGSSESPAQALAITVRGSGPAPTLRFTADPDTTTVFDDDFRPIDLGSGIAGRLATSGRVPLYYHKDPERSQRTFVTVDGVRWALPGDMATIEADGTIRLLGRGSMCINTGGEKVYPEEVEAVLKAHPAISDAIVVGAADARLGQRVAAVVQAADGAPLPTLEDVRDHCRASLAGHKVPRALFVVERVVRSPAGKADYAWAQRVAAGELPAAQSASA